MGERKIMSARCTVSNSMVRKKKSMRKCMLLKYHDVCDRVSVRVIM